MSATLKNALKWFSGFQEVYKDNTTHPYRTKQPRMYFFTYDSDYDCD